MDFDRPVILTYRLRGGEVPEHRPSLIDAPHESCLRAERLPMSPSEELLPVSETSRSEPAPSSRRSIDYDIDNILDQIGLGAALEPAAPARFTHPAHAAGPVPSRSEPPAAPPPSEPQIVAQLEEISSTLASLDTDTTVPPAELATAQQQPDFERQGQPDCEAAIEPPQTAPETETPPQSSRAVALQVLEEEIIRRTAEISQQRRAIERDRAALEEAQANWRQELKSQQQAMEAERQQFVTRQRMIRQEQTEWEKRSAEFAAERTRLREQKQALQLQAAELAAERERVELQAATILVGARVAEITVNERNNYEAQRAALQAERDRSAQLESQLTAAREAEAARQQDFAQTQQQQLAELQAERDKTAQLEALLAAAHAEHDSGPQSPDPDQSVETDAVAELQTRVEEALAQRTAADSARHELLDQVSALETELAAQREAFSRAVELATVVAANPVPEPELQSTTPAAPETNLLTAETDTPETFEPESVATTEDTPGLQEAVVEATVGHDPELRVAEPDADLPTETAITVPVLEASVDDDSLPPSDPESDSHTLTESGPEALVAELPTTADEHPIFTEVMQPDLPPPAEPASPPNESPELAAAVSRIANLLAACPGDSAPAPQLVTPTPEPTATSISHDDDEQMDFADRLARLRAEMMGPRNTEPEPVVAVAEEPTLSALTPEDLCRRRTVVDVDAQRDHRNSLREVAQASAHSALSHYRGKQLRFGALLKTGIALLCFLAAIAFLSGEFVGNEVAWMQGTLFLVIGIYFAFDAFQKVVQLGVIMARRRSDLKSLLELSGMAAVSNPSGEGRSTTPAGPDVEAFSGPQIT